MSNSNKRHGVHFFKSLGNLRENHGLKVGKFLFAMRKPSIQVLTDHRGVNANVPHLCRAVAPGFQLVVNLLPFIGSLDGSSALVG